MTPIVLVVDDEEPLRRFLRIVLERQGFTVLLASDGVEALEAFQRADPPVDVVLTDLMMPRMDGRELAQRLAMLRPSLPIVFMSGYVKPSNLLFEGMPKRDRLFLQKPFEMEDVVKTVRAALEEPRE